MKLVTYQPQSGSLRLAALDADTSPLALSPPPHPSPHPPRHPPPLRSALALLAAGPTGLAAARAALQFAQQRGAGDPRWSLDLAHTRLRAPVPRPGKVLALAGNYRAHRAEGGVSSPEPTQALPEVF